MQTHASEPHFVKLTQFDIQETGSIIYHIFVSILLFPDPSFPYSPIPLFFFFLPPLFPLAPTVIVPCRCNQVCLPRIECGAAGCQGPPSVPASALPRMFYASPRTEWYIHMQHVMSVVSRVACECPVESVPLPHLLFPLPLSLLSPIALILSSLISRPHYSSF